MAKGKEAWLNTLCVENHLFMSVELLPYIGIPAYIVEKVSALMKTPLWLCRTESTDNKPINDKDIIRSQHVQPRK